MIASGDEPCNSCDSPTTGAFGQPSRTAAAESSKQNREPLRLGQPALVQKLLKFAENALLLRNQGHLPHGHFPRSPTLALPPPPTTHRTTFTTPKMRAPYLRQTLLPHNRITDKSHTRTKWGCCLVKKRHFISSAAVRCVLPHSRPTTY